MTNQEKYLVVVSVREGKGFPNRQKLQLVVEARFDGELLSTDPVEHHDTPDFTQELAWELSKKSLQQHKLQRSSIKVQVYTVDPQTAVKDAVGYVVLDLRSAKNMPTAKWLPLLHSKYSKTRAEILIGIYMDEGSTNGVAVDPSNSKATKPRLPPLDASFLKKGGLKPVLHEDVGGQSYYRIGPTSHCDTHFLLSVTIASATNLTQLIPSTVTLPPGAAFFFYFSLLGNDVINEKFYNLMQPEFPAERATVRVKSSVQLLQTFFTNQPGLQVHLCCGDQSLGKAEVSLAPLLPQNSTEIYMKPITIESLFKLEAPNRTKQSLPAASGQSQAKVGVNVTLRCDDSQQKTVREEPTEPDHVEQKKPSKTAEAVPEREKNDSYSEDFDEDSQRSDASVSESPGRGSKPKQQNVKERVQEAIKQQAMQPTPEAATVRFGPDAHYLSFSADLRCVANLQGMEKANVYLRYVYPFFGSPTPIVTHPAVELTSESQVSVPNSFCEFEFATSTEQLRAMFNSTPLCVEAWDSRATEEDALLGTALLPLDKLVQSPTAKATRANGTSGVRQSLTVRLPVVAVEGGGQVMQLDAVLELHDWGPMSTAATAESSGPSGPRQTQLNTVVDMPPDTRKTLEYQAALELEVWKEAQQKLFESQLKKKEAQHMTNLTEQWKQAHKQQQLLVQKRLAEYEALEKKLKKTLLDLEKSEKTIATKEQDLKQARTELEREHARNLCDVKEASRRVQNECEHRVGIEQQKTAALDEIIVKLKQQINDWESRYQKLEQEFSTYKDQQGTKPEIRLQTEINMLTIEKAELERKLEASSRSKSHYKQQWGRTLRELAKSRQREQQMAKQALRKQEQELEHLRLRYLAAEEQTAMTSERSQLAELRRELEQVSRTQLNSSAPPDLWRPLAPDTSTVQDEHVARLVQERDTLLRTGVYTSQDRIIAELERQIQEAMNQQSDIAAARNITDSRADTAPVPADSAAYSQADSVPLIPVS